MEPKTNQPTKCNDCMVCLCPMNELDHTVITNCGHIFHTECISTWYDSTKQTNKFNCPACRQSLFSTPKIINETPESNNTICTYFNGTIIEGERKNGEFNGPCKLTYADGNVLEGEYKNDEFIGPCKLTYPDGVVIEGERKNGLFTGHCKLTYADGDFLEGERKNGAFNGPCKLTKPGKYFKEFYEGEQKNGNWFGQVKNTHVYESLKINRVEYCEVKNGYWKYKFKYHIGTPVFQYDKKCNLIKKFDSIKSCAKSLKTGRYQITNRLKNIKCCDTARYPANYYLNQYVFTTTII
jgi:hypothetical protein